MEETLCCNITKYVHTNPSYNTAMHELKTPPSKEVYTLVKSVEPHLFPVTFNQFFNI